MQHTAFPTPQALADWLENHHAVETELWVRIYKKASGVPSVTWNDCVVEALAWGWIDGQRQSLDDVSYLQRLTPRMAGSNWSRKNRDHAERLISQGRMQPAGLRHVQDAKADGRWDASYAGQADMSIPQDFLDAVAADPVAQAFFDTLNRSNLFRIYYQLVTAKTPETRTRRMQKLLGQLSRQEKFY
jgi:uncharacterized protein YdeI (YjbR/CyaY-like superfamily)